MYSTRVTKLKKTAGEVVYNYDIYIGPEIKNSSWSLVESVWHNPYQFSGGSLKRRYELYKKRISEPQRRESCDLEKIRGKMLACICPDVTSCHGHVLARMVHDKHPEYENIFRASPEDESLSIDGGDVVFFKGQECPLSNYYYCDEHSMEFCTVAGDDDEECVLSDDSDYDEPELKYGARQAFAALKARKMGLMKSYRKIVSPRNASQLHAAIGEMEYHIRAGNGKLWKTRDTIKTMHHIISDKWLCMPPFEEYCEALGSKIPCEATKNEFWACGLDMEVLRSLDPRLRVHYMKGKNILGWIIKVVMTQLGPEMGDYSWVRPALGSDSLSDSVKEGLADVLTALNLKKYAIPETARCYFEEKEVVVVDETRRRRRRRSARFEEEGEGKNRLLKTKLFFFLYT